LELSNTSSQNSDKGVLTQITLCSPQPAARSPQPAARTPITNP
jgi:hypothetical protein